MEEETLRVTIKTRKGSKWGTLNWKMDLPHHYLADIFPVLGARVDQFEKEKEYKANIACPNCGERLKSKSALGAHRRWRHREVPKLPEMPYIN